MLGQGDDLYDYNFLQEVPTPSQFAFSSQNINKCIEDAFYEKCVKFIEEERRFYKCSKIVEKKLETAALGNVQMHQKLIDTSQNVSKIAKNIKKLNISENNAKNKELFLNDLCQIIKMQKHRQILINDSNFDQKLFLQALQQLNQTVISLEQWDTDIHIILQIKSELQQLLQQTVKKLIKEKLSDSLIKQIIGPYSLPLLKDDSLTTVFINNLKNNRLSHFRIGLNPLVNNISYAQNISELYESIVDTWVQMLEEQIQLFSKQNVPQQLRSVPKEVMRIIVQQIIPKLQRNIYKVKDIIQVAKIRYYLSQLRKKLIQISKQDWDPLPKFLVKSHILLEEKLDHEGQQLQIAKYNIYSLASYIPIRQHLENIKICKNYDTNNLNDAPIEWQKAFAKLTNSRQPFKNSNNKSLVLFNLNVWYLYDKIIKIGSLSEKCRKVIEWCTQRFIQINLSQVKKKYSANNFQQLLDIGSNTQQLKKTIFGQISLLGHQGLRKVIQDGIRNKFIETIYFKLLEANDIPQSGLEGEKLMQKIKQKKINLNKYGKKSESLIIYSSKGLLEQLK